MKVIVTNSTGSQKVNGVLHPFGVIELESGEVTTVSHEKQFGKVITKLVEAPLEEVKETISEQPKTRATRKKV